MTSESSPRLTTGRVAGAIVWGMEFLANAEQQTATGWFLDQLASAATSPQGQVAMVERSAPEGHMPPLLRRSEAETYRVLEGEVVFFVGDDMVLAGPGDVVVAPRDVPRTFRVTSGDARWLVLTQVSSLGRAVSLPLAAPCAGWPSPEECAAVAATGAVNGIELLGPPGALPRGDPHDIPTANHPEADDLLAS
jgi:mannose-6-phosphate isomerase-like protein (cupin superfamily)